MTVAQVLAQLFVSVDDVLHMTRGCQKAHSQQGCSQGDGAFVTNCTHLHLHWQKRLDKPVELTESRMKMTEIRRT